MVKYIHITVNFFIGFILTALPFLPGGNPSSLFLTIIGIFLIIIGTMDLHNKGHFSRRIYRLILALLALIGLFLIIYIYIYLPASHSLLFLFVLGLAVLLLLSVVYTLINNRKISKFIKGSKLAEDTKYQESLDYFDKYIESDPNDPLAWSGKAYALIKMNKYEEALECSNKSLDINLGINKFLSKKVINSIRLNVKGIVLLKLKKYDEALNYFDQALELRSSYYGVLNNKGYTLSKLGNYEEAINCYNKVLNFDPKDPYALSNKGETLRKLGKYQEAIEYIDKALEINSKLPFIWLNKGETLMAMNRNDEAIEYIDKSLELDPIFESAINAKEELLKSVGK